MFFDEKATVETVSRHPKPIVDVAENLSLVTAAQIKAMNAHTLYEVLSRVPGLYLSFNGADFGSAASVTIHGSRFEDEHRLVVLLDGIRLNSASNGVALLNGIPVGIIDRLEIINGPASSTWGSAIGGVINIITKKPAESVRPIGQLSASYGKADSRDLRSELEGGGAGRKYYLHAGNQYSDGLLGNRYFDNSQAFGKVVFAPSERSRLTLSGGINNPEWKSGDFIVSDQRYTSENAAGFASANFDHFLSSRANIHLDGSLTSFDQSNDSTVLGTGMFGPAGSPFLHQNWQEKRISLGGRLVYALDRHMIVIGAEGWHDQLDYHLAAGPAAVSAYRLPKDYRAKRAKNDNYAVFVSDTIHLGSLTVIPGLRYDDNSLGEGFVSPSLGATYPFSPETRLRATVARGFSSPYLSLVKEVSPFLLINPDLAPEKIWSVRAGLETKAVPMLLLKTTAFYHDIDDVWSYNSQRMIVNRGTSKRSGFEMELETVPWRRLTLAASLAYTYDRPEEGRDDDFSQATLKVGYTNPAVANVELFGSYIHWLDAATYLAEGDNFIWDLNVSRVLATGHRTSVELFSTLHNLTDADQYWSVYYQNPGRWLEVGLRINF